MLIEEGGEIVSQPSRTDCCSKPQSKTNITIRAVHVWCPYMVTNSTKILKFNKETTSRQTHRNVFLANISAQNPIHIKLTHPRYDIIGHWIPMLFRCVLQARSTVAVEDTGQGYRRLPAIPDSSSVCAD